MSVSFAFNVTYMISEPTTQERLHLGDIVGVHAAVEVLLRRRGGEQAARAQVGVGRTHRLGPGAGHSSAFQLKLSRFWILH
jgi:hypothetical protein